MEGLKSGCHPIKLIYERQRPLHIPKLFKDLSVQKMLLCSNPRYFAFAVVYQCLVVSLALQQCLFLWGKDVGKQ